MPNWIRSSLLRYGIAPLAVGTALLLRFFLLWSVLGPEIPFLLLWPVVMISAWYGGLGPGLLATLLAAVAADCFFFEPGALGLGKTTEWTSMGLFVGLGALISLLTEGLHRARRQVEKHASELYEQREWLRITLDSIDDGVLATDAAGRVTFLNTVAQALTGWKLDEAAEQPLERVLQLVHEKTRAPVESPTRRALASGTVVTLDVPAVLLTRNGNEVPIDDSATPIYRADGRALGAIVVFRDIRERRRAEETLRLSEQRFREAVLHAPVPIMLHTDDGEVLQISDTWTELTGYTQEDIPTLDHWLTRAYTDRKDAVAKEITASFGAGGRLPPREYTVTTRGGDKRTWEFNTALLGKMPDGRQVRIVTALDLTERKRAEAGLHFLAQTGTMLASLQDFESTLEQVTRFAVPFLADWCILDVVAADGQVQRVASAHADPGKERLVRELRTKYRPDWNSSALVLAVLRSGEAELVADVSDRMLEQIAVDPEHLQCLRVLGPRSYLCVPLTVRERTLGALALVFAESGRRYGAADLALAEEFAGRAAAAIEIAGLYRDLREADAHKNRFLAMLGHELRNPLAPIRNASEFLRLKGSADPELRWASDIIGRQVQHMTRLVDDLLDVSRVSRGKIQLRKERIDLAAALAQAVETSRPLLEARKHRLTVSVPDEPLWLDGDLTRLAQVIGNLLNNAAKYTAEGGQVHLAVARDGEEAVLRVRDTGAGIPADMLHRVFELFTQVNHVLDRSQGGLGIGLTLVRSLVEMHGGSVQAFSGGPGKGSEFVVRLPLVPGPPQGDEAIAPGPDDPAEAAAYRILIVDDNTDAAESLALFLRLAGHHVRTVYDGPAALASAGVYRPQVIFLDLGLPGMDGYEVARRLGTDVGLEDMVLVALTGYGQDEDRQRVEAAGFDHHLVKPVAPEVLQGLLAQVMAAVP